MLQVCVQATRSGTGYLILGLRTVLARSQIPKNKQHFKPILEIVGSRGEAPAMSAAGDYFKSKCSLFTVSTCFFSFHGHIKNCAFQL
jgi:hypothetical protein